MFNQADMLEVVKNTYKNLLDDKRVLTPPPIPRLISFAVSAELAYSLGVANNDYENAIKGVIRSAIKSLSHAIRVAEGDPRLLVLRAVVRALKEEIKNFTEKFAERAKEEKRGEKSDIEALRRSLSDVKLTKEQARELLRRIPEDVEEKLQKEYWEAEVSDSGKKKIRAGSPGVIAAWIVSTKAIAERVLGIAVPFDLDIEAPILASDKIGEHLIRLVNQMVGEDAPLDVKLKALRELLSKIMRKIEEESLNELENDAWSKQTLLRKTSSRVILRSAVGEHIVEQARQTYLGMERYGTKPYTHGVPTKRIKRRLTMRKILSRMLREQRIRYEDVVIKTYKPGTSACFIIALDVSGSMNGAGIFTSKLDDCKIIVQKLIDLMDKDDKIGILTFEARPDVLTLPVRIREFKKRILAFLPSMEANGGTKISKVMSKAREILLERGERTKSLILITDGDTKDDEEECIRVAKMMAREGITISTIAIGNFCKTRFLKLLAKIGRGSFVAIRNIRDTSRLVDAIRYR